MAEPAAYPDETPYPYKAYPGIGGRGIQIVKQDNHPGYQPGESSFPFIRKLLAQRDGRWFHIDLTLWKKPPREYPPIHIGDSTVGINLALDEVAALWHLLGEHLAEMAAEDQREGRA